MSMSSANVIRMLCLNPNTSIKFTEKIEKCVNKFLVEKNLNQVVSVTATNPVSGPMSIESIYDEVLSSQSCLKYLIENVNKYDGIIIACFSDHPLIYCARELLSIPVVGIMDASCYSACFVGHKFSIINTSKQWETLLFDGIQRLGLLNKCASIRSCNLPVLSLEHNENDIESKLISESEIAVLNDGADVIILGCAGMVGL
eukprot:UN03703